MSATAINPTDQDTELPDGPGGQLKAVDVPRVGIVLDETDPTVIKLSFSGAIDLERGVADDVAFFNSLKAGQTVTLTLDAHVAGAKTTHRRDSEGDVDAVVQTKSLIVHSLETA